MYSSKDPSTPTYGDRAIVRTISPNPAWRAASADSAYPGSPESRNHRSARRRTFDRSAVASSAAASELSTTGPNSGVCQLVGEVTAPALSWSGMTPVSRPSRRTASASGLPDPNARSHGSIQPGRTNGDAPVLSASSSHSSRNPSSEEWTSTDAGRPGRRAPKPDGGRPAREWAS